MALTLNQALALNEIHQSDAYTSRHTCRVWRRNGSTQTWKTRPTDYRIPVKHGLYAYDNITNQTHNVHAPYDCPLLTPAQRHLARAANTIRIANERAYRRRRSQFDSLVALGYIEWNTTLAWWAYADTHLPYPVRRDQLV